MWGNPTGVVFKIKFVSKKSVPKQLIMLFCYQVNTLKLFLKIFSLSIYKHNDAGEGKNY